MKKFRVLFSLSENAAEKFSAVENKSEYVSLALEWFINFGIDFLEKIKKIESVLEERVVENRKPNDYSLDSTSKVLENYEEKLRKVESVIIKRLEQMEVSILKELGFQGTESLKDRDVIKEEMARLSRKIDMMLRY